MSTLLKPDFTAVVAPIEVGGISTLILDDNQFDRMKIRRLLSNTGIPVYFSEIDTVQSLSDVLDKQEFDVILVDYNLSDSTGIDALEVVQNHPVNAQAATIMITGYDQSEIAVKALKMGCTDYITKEQLSAERLRKSVLSAIEASELARSADIQHDTYSEELARDLMAEYSTSLQPEIAQIINELRLLKASLPQHDENRPLDINQIEQRCIRLWSVLGNPSLPKREEGSTSLLQ
ncbi:MAG: response regulator [Roseovarius sp.]